MPIQTPWDLRIDIDGTSFANRAQENDDALASAMLTAPLTVWRPTTTTTNYSAVANDLVICTSGTFTVTSPAASAGRQFAVFNKGTGVITVATAAGSIFGGGLLAAGGGTLSLAIPGSSVTMTSNGTDWFVVGGGMQTGWLALTSLGYQNGWVDQGGGITGQYMKDPNGFVHLRGLVKNGTNSTLAVTLPAGFRPGTQNINAFCFQVTGTAADIQIATSGTVTIFAGSVTTNQVALDNVLFLAEN